MKTRRQVIEPDPVLALPDVAPGRASVVPGIGVCLAIALLASEIARLPGLAAYGLSALTLSVLFGMFIGNTVFAAAAPSCGPGLEFARQTVLRAGIVLYGFRLTFSDVAQIGAAGLLADAVMIGTTFVLAIWLGRRVFKLDRADAILIGAGAAVCGAAAVLAAGSVVKASAAQTTVAVATVVLFGTIAMFVYPLLYPMLAESFSAHPGSFGIYVGSTVHEVAQAIAAGSMFDPTTADMALVAKLGRVAMLGPVLLLLAAWYASLQSKDEPSSRPRFVIPWFAIGFLAASALNSLVHMPPLLLQALNYAGTLFLGVAMAALGLGAQIGVMRRAGAKPVLLAMMLAVWLLAGGLIVNLGILALR